MFLYANFFLNIIRRYSECNSREVNFNYSLYNCEETLSSNI